MNRRELLQGALLTVAATCAPAALAALPRCIPITGPGITNGSVILYHGGEPDWLQIKPGSVWQVENIGDSPILLSWDKGSVVQLKSGEKCTISSYHPIEDWGRK